MLMRSEILSYSRTRGLFAGVSLEGSTLRHRRRCYPNLRPQTDGKEIVIGERSGIRPSSDCRTRQKFAEKRVEKRIREEIAVGSTNHLVLCASEVIV